MKILLDASYPGKVYRCKCGKCNSIFEFDDTDAEYFFESFKDIKIPCNFYSIRCPRCNERIIYGLSDEDYEILRKQIKIGTKSFVEQINYDDSMHKDFLESKYNNISLIDWIQYKIYFKNKSGKSETL